MIALCLACAARVAASAPPPAQDDAAGWIQLFNGKNLDGWYVCLEGEKPNADSSGCIQVKEGVIHVYPDHPAGKRVPRGYFGTLSQFSSYHLRFEYKWGEKKFSPRTNQPRDAGLLYHVTPPDKVWPRSIECQIQEGDTGDCFLVRGAQAATTVADASAENNVFQFRTPADGGVSTTIGHPRLSRIIKSDTQERDGWNTVEVVVRGADEVTHIVNGKSVFHATDLKRLDADNQTWIPLTHGHLAFQAEYAEVLYRNIEIGPLAGAALYPAAQLQVAEGFDIVQAAGPPLVDYPTLACFDERGRLYVSEGANNNDSFEGLAQSLPRSIRRLEDADGDGIFDRSTVFADKMTFPYGGQWYRGALYVASDPSLWRLEDTDEDGVADQREEILTGFRSQGMGSAMKGAYFGRDGWLYFTGGNENGYDLRGRDGTHLRDHRSRPCVFRMRPDGSGLEVVANGAAGVYDLFFPPSGEVLGVVTILKYPRGDGLMHWIDGGAYQSSHSVSPHVPLTGPLLPPIVQWGQTSPSGAMQLEGNGFGKDYAGNVFTAHFGTHEVTRNVIERDGATWRSTFEEPFVRSDQANFRPTDILQDADGTLLLVDTGGWFRIGCPTARADASALTGGIYRIRKRGMTVPADPRGQRIDWQNARADQLVGLLDDERFAVRERAIDRLAQMGAAAIPALEAALADASCEVRRNAVWTLSRIDSSEARRSLRKAIRDVDRSVVLAALHSAGLWRDRSCAELASECLKSCEPAVRRNAALALGRVADPAAVPALLSALATAHDRFEQHALIHALIQINDREAVLAGLQSDNPRIQAAALLALDQMPRGNLSEELVQSLLPSESVELETTVLDLYARHSQWRGGIVQLIARWLADVQAAAPAADRREILANALSRFHTAPQVQSLIAENLSDDANSAEVKEFLLEQMVSFRLRRFPRVWQRPVARLLDSPQAPIALRAIEVAGRDLSRFHDALIALALADDRALEVRLSAAVTALKADAPVPQPVFELLTAHCLAPQTDPLTRLSIAQSLGDANLTPQQQKRLANLAASAGPLELPLLLRAFEETDEPAAAQELLAALAVSPGTDNLAPQRLRRLFDRYPQNLQADAAKLLDRFSGRSEAQSVRLRQLQSALSGGDAVRGRILFNTKATCHACHRVGGKGSTVGPDLTQIGKIRTRTDLLEAIAFPSASLARGYESITVITHSGHSINGVRRRETHDAIYLVTADRSEIAIARDEIDEIVPSSVSIMPQGLDRNLSEAELRDLLAYLESLKS